MAIQTQRTDGGGFRAPRMDSGSPLDGRAGVFADAATVRAQDGTQGTARQGREPMILVPPIPLRPPTAHQPLPAEECAVLPVPFIRLVRSVDSRSGAEPGTDAAVGSERVRPADRATRRADARRRRADDRVIRRARGRVLDQEAGMATAEYAIATLAAVGFAALLVAVLSSGEVKGLLMSLITSALNFG